MEIASPFVSPVMEIVIKKMISYLERQMNWRKDFEAGLYKLKLSLLKSMEVVASTEMTQLTPGQKQILSEVKKVVYEADDFLDELDFDNLEKQAKTQTKKADICSSLRRKTISALKFRKRLIGKDEMHNNLDEILKKLDLVNGLALDILLAQSAYQRTSTRHVNPAVHIPNKRLTSSNIKEKEIFGRDNEKEKLVRILTKSSDEPKEGDKNSIAVVALVGQGGNGKTTLAQHVYHDERIKDHFGLTIWVFVSTSFDKFSLTKQILDSASQTSETHKDITNFDMLVNRLQEKLMSKRFLLVLDDIWFDENLNEFENKSHWTEFLSPLQVGDSSSKIFVTTREIRTAKALEATDIPLEGLADEDFSELLCSCAFRDLKPTNHLELEAIAKEIAKRLKGSPLAAKVIGGMLRDKLEVNYWKEISKTKMFDDITKILKLSYDSLPNYLKPCFSICGVFPRDWKFDPMIWSHFG